MRGKIDWTPLFRALEHDEANGVEWWKDAEEDAKFAVWKAIQGKHDDPVMEIMSRFAQIGMTHIALLAEKERHGRH